MKQLRVLKVTFDHFLKPYEIASFRGAIIDAVGWERELYHNHSNQDGNKRLHYRYPLIQYRQNHHKPMLVFLDDAVEEAHRFFDKETWEINMKGSPVTLKIDRLDLQQYNLAVFDKVFYFNLFKWQALNQTNYEEWMKLEGLIEKTEFLQRKLVAHIISFAKGVGWEIDKRFDLQILEVKQEKYLRFKGFQALTFDIRFKANVFLPEHIGIGKAVSHGFGTLRKSPTAKKPGRRKDRGQESMPAAGSPSRG